MATETSFLNREDVAIYRGDYAVYDKDGKQMYTDDSFVIPAFTKSAAFTLKIIDDGVDEAEENITINLVAGSSSTNDVIIDATDKDVLFSIAENNETGSGIKALNDTGVTKAVLVGDASLEGLEDHNIGRDKSSPESTDGLSGFVFTKLDVKGVAIDQSIEWSETDTSKQWRCVRDEVTGLLWEIKTVVEGGYQSSLNRVNWFDNDPNSNGGNSGELGVENCETLKTCNTMYIAAQANLDRLCGKTGWRMPTIEELRTLARYAAHEDPVGAKYALDPAYFPDDRQDTRYWSSTTSAVNADMAYTMKFGEGVTETSDFKKISVPIVRLVNDQ